MGLSSNQARFLSLTSRQVDLEQRVQQICQRRLRLSSELERVATQYNDSISNRKMFVPNVAELQTLSLNSLASVGLRVIDKSTSDFVSDNSNVLMKTPAAADPTATVINTEAQLLNLISVMNGGDAAATAALAGKYVLGTDINLSDNGTFSNSVIQGDFTGVFDGQGHSITGLDISATAINVGFFASVDGASAVVKNISIVGANVVSSNSNVGILAGNFLNGAKAENISTTGSVSGIAGVGGAIGKLTSGSISDSYSTANVAGTNWNNGGLVGVLANAGVIQRSYATGSVTALSDSGGLVGNSSGSISDSYATGDVNIELYGGGFAGSTTGGSIVRSYSTSNLGTVGLGPWGGFVGYSQVNVSNNTNFYKNNLSVAASGSTSSAVDANVVPVSMPTTTWSPTVWDLSGVLPELLKNTPQHLTSESLEQKIRNGEYSLAREADEFTQNPLYIGGESYEKVDWRTVPSLNDELFKVDDVDAEDKYDRTIAQINSQDKKLQLEQSSVEVAYKAISSEKEAVKKILDANSSSSFKYFS